MCILTLDGADLGHDLLTIFVMDYQQKGGALLKVAAKGLIFRDGQQNWYC